MVAWLTHLQHTPNKNVWLVGLLNKQLDDFNRPFFALQVEGSKTGLELPGIVDEVITSDKAVRVLQACDAGEWLPRIAAEPDHPECARCPWRTRCWS